MKLYRKAPELADAALRALATEGVNHAKLSIQNSPATGAAYARSSGRVHIASSEGNPPRIDMGTLWNSIRWRRVADLDYEIVDGVEYGEILEFILNRPFFTPMTLYLRDQAPRFFNHFLDGV